ncbi:MAG: hypothetical protein ACOX46_07425 [Limnochordia bacterium]|jgi:hypothetical protein
MVGLVILVYAAVAAFELWLWAERPWQKVLLYLVLFAGATTLAVLLVLNPDLKVPEPLGFLEKLLKRLWQKGGSV